MFFFYTNNFIVFHLRSSYYDNYIGGVWIIQRTRVT